MTNEDGMNGIDVDTRLSADGNTPRALATVESGEESGQVSDCESGRDSGQQGEDTGEEDDSESGESGSTCTILQRGHQQANNRRSLSLEEEEEVNPNQQQHEEDGDQDQDGHSEDVQILSISNLPNVAANLETTTNAYDSRRRQEVEEIKLEAVVVDAASPLVEIDLNQVDRCGTLQQQQSCNSNNHHKPSLDRDPAVQGEDMQFAAYRHDDELAGCDTGCTPAALLDHHHHQRHHIPPQQGHHYHASAIHHHQQQQQPHPLPFRGFSEAQPKLSFASQRVKEYFESFKSHRGETVRLYQFFKSTRTELVACLLFSLITSQALIVLRSNLADQDPSWPSTETATAAASSQLIDDGARLLRATESREQLQVSGGLMSVTQQRTVLADAGGKRNTAAVHLANGLVMSLTVASLTQVFGHISGCHLIPSVSLSLYVKGHISRARLASYLVAQFLGSGLGVALLSLLSSSQISANEYRDTLRATTRLTRQDVRDYRARLAAEGAADGERPAISMGDGSGGAGGNARRRREAAAAAATMPDPSDLLLAANATANGSGELQAADDVNLGADFQTGSETILLSILEQQQLARSNLPDNKGPGGGRRGDEPGPADERAPRSKAISISAASTYSPQVVASSTPRPPGAAQSSPAPSEALGGAAADGRPSAGPLATYPASNGAAQTSSQASKQEATAAAANADGTAGSGGSPTAPINGPRPVWPLSPAPVADPLGSSGHHLLSLAAETARPPADGKQQQQQQQLDDDHRGSPDDRSRASLAAGETTSPIDGAPSSLVVARAQGEAASRAPFSGSSLIGANLGQADAGAGNNKRVVKLKLKRRKRNKQEHGVSGLLTPPAANNGSTITTTTTTTTTNNDIETGSNLLAASAGAASRNYINLLEFTLPDQIMSSESIRQCIDKQQPAEAAAAAPKWTSAKQHNQQQQQQEALVYMQFAGRSFNQCLSLSNSSQMFVFQFVATLLVVLTYLVNVDPRRIDLGFKSLSIGLAYFVACALTVHSGGFFGNPFHLLFLNWLSTTSEWRSEWFIYLITPLIGGLFGAISHEYIDFSSLRNRNKQLHLRRSFYSLDNIAQIVGCAATTSTTSNDGCVTGAGGHRSDSHATVVEIASIHNAAAARSRKVSSSSSLESAGAPSSSMMSLNGPDPVGYPSTSSAAATAAAAAAAAVAAQQHHLNPLHHQASPTNHHYSNIKPQQQLENCPDSFGTNRKLISYSRQLRIEQQRAAAARTPGCGGPQFVQHAATVANGACSNHQQQQKHSQANGGARASLRRSDFDSNFLISSSCSTTPPTASKRQIHTSGWM